MIYIILCPQCDFVNSGEPRSYEINNKIAWIRFKERQIKYSAAPRISSVEIGYPNNTKKLNLINGQPC